MTDYLEEALDNAQALLDQVKRLEQGLSEGETGKNDEVPALVPGTQQETALKEGRQTRGGASEEEQEPDQGTGLADGERKGRQQSVERSGEAESSLERKSGTLEAPRRVQTPLEAEEKISSSLLDQLETLEQAAGRAAPASGGGWGPGRAPWPGVPSPASLETAFPNAADAAGTGRSIGRVLADSAAQSSEELRWAEQADRVFRRDSRRYDGGFYLY